jgi:hypothetical protein
MENWSPSNLQMPCVGFQSTIVDLIDGEGSGDQSLSQFPYVANMCAIYPQLG